MPKLHEIVADLVQASDGLVGRVRLQKLIYLLDQKGLNSGAAYFYHHYGPYSDDVWDAVADAKFFEGLKEETSTSGEPTPSSVFSLRGHRQLSACVGDLPADEVSEFLKKLKYENSTVLELAATVHWLAFVENVADWRTEIERRKAGKTGYGRLGKALKLLQELELAPRST